MKLIINADDFGLDENCTRAIDEAFAKQLITSTTICANGEAFARGVSLAKEHGLVEKIGVHLNITEGTPLTEQLRRMPLFCNSQGQLVRSGYRVLTPKEARALYQEFDAQIQKIQAAGIPITHLDSHHHIHTNPFILPVAAAAARKNGIRRVRLHRNLGQMGRGKRMLFSTINRILRKAYGFETADWFWSAPVVAEALDTLPKDAVVEVMVHPRYDSGCLIDARANDGQLHRLEDAIAPIREKKPDAQLIHY